MNDERIRHALQAEAADTPAAQDLWAATTHRMRRRRMVRGSSAVAAVLLVAVAGAAAVAQLAGGPQEMLLGGDPGPPDGWQQVPVGPAVVAVPPDWQVHDLSEVTDDQPDPLIEEHPEPAPAPDPDSESVPCPAIDPDQPALLHSTHRLPAGCPDDPAALTGVMVTPLDGPTPWFPPPVLEAGEPVTVGGHPARAVDAALLSSAAESDLDQGQEGGATTFIVPSLGVHLEAHHGVDPDDVEAVLDTLTARDDADDDAVLQSTGFDGEPDGDYELVGWAVDADGRYHPWLREPVAPGEAGSQLWPAATANRFGALIHTDGRSRIITARPGDEPTVHALSDDVDRDTLAWSPTGEALAWLTVDPQPRLTVVDWRDPDRLADGEEPERLRVATTGLPDDQAIGLRWLPHDGPDVDRLVVTYPDDHTFVADVGRDHEGLLDLDDPLTFTPSW